MAYDILFRIEKKSGWDAVSRADYLNAVVDSNPLLSVPPGRSSRGNKRKKFAGDRYQHLMGGSGIGGRFQTFKAQLLFTHWWAS